MYSIKPFPAAATSGGLAAASRRIFYWVLSLLTLEDKLEI